MVPAFAVCAIAEPSSGPNTLSGRRSVTDGNADTEWRFDNAVEVLGKWIRLELMK